MQGFMSKQQHHWPSITVVWKPVYLSLRGLGFRVSCHGLTEVDVAELVSAVHPDYLLPEPYILSL